MEKIKRELNTIYVLWLRQIKRYYRSRARMLGSLGQPILFLVALGFGFGPIFEKAGGGNYIQFLAPGVISMSIIFSAMFSGIEVIVDKQFGFLKETLVAPVSRSSIMIGRTFGGATASIIQGIVVMLMAMVVGFRPEFSISTFLVVVFMALSALFFTGFGTTLGSYIEDMHAFPLIMNFIVMPLFFLSGALFPLAGLPKGISMVASLNPLSYGVDGIRGVFLAQSHFGLLTDFFVLLFFVVVILLIGTRAFSRIQA